MQPHGLKERANDRVEILNAKVNQNTESSLLDLSISGAAFHSNNGYKIGSDVNVSVGSLELKAQVVYSNERSDGFRIGLHFGGLDSSQKQELQNLVEKFSKGVPLTGSILMEVSQKSK